MTTQCRSLHNVMPKYAPARKQQGPLTREQLRDPAVLDPLVEARKVQLSRVETFQHETTVHETMPLVCTKPENTPPNEEPPMQVERKAAIYAKFDNSQLHKDVVSYR